MQHSHRPKPSAEISSGPDASSSDVVIEIRRGRARQLVRKVQAPVYLIGSGRDCDLVLADDQFPAVHAYVYVRRDSLSLRQIGDGPEITVNGCPVRWTSLVDGDRIRTGPFEFRVAVQTHSSKVPMEQPGKSGAASPKSKGPAKPKVIGRRIRFRDLPAALRRHRSSSIITAIEPHDVHAEDAAKIRRLLKEIRQAVYPGSQLQQPVRRAPQTPQRLQYPPTVGMPGPIKTIEDIEKAILAKRLRKSA